MSIYHDPYLDSSLSAERLAEISQERATLRRKLLYFIRKNQHLLPEGHVKIRAKRGYLRDLNDSQIRDAVEEIYKNV